MMMVFLAMMVVAGAGRKNKVYRMRWQKPKRRRKSLGK
jgi:hypothetical protein